MTKWLVPCSACLRHVRSTETTCPFCGVELPVSLRGVPAPEPPPDGLGRAGLFAYGQRGAVKAVVGAALLAAAACDSPTMVSAYGAAPPPLPALQEASTSDTSTAPDAPVMNEVYGGPPPDAGRPDAARQVSVPAYGAPPPHKP